MGIIMLVGIVKKNAIMMTTMAALMGTLPIALGLGAGAESRRSLGLAVVGGLLLSQLLTLYITPVVYLYLDLFQHAAGPTWQRLLERLRRRGPAAARDHASSAGSRPAPERVKIP